MPGRDTQSKSEQPLVLRVYRKFPEDIKSITRKVLKYSNIRPYTDILFDSPIRDRGWFNCYSAPPTDQCGNPIPWMPYSLIDFISDRLHSGLNVFEYGSGNSTEWFATYVSQVFSVEHNKDWYEKINGSLPSNAKILYRTGKKYITAIDEYDGFDIVVIDGKYRNECVKKAVQNLNSEGIILLDDTYRDQNKKIVDDLTGGEFKEIFFQGIGPVTSNIQKTSIIYRRNNCLDI
ncbi:hypothetical protein [Halobellus salinus]|nr:hypothetical protein [Halobellus salinus]SMP18047.1 hypothetical protein SAMN06265347_106113 [Halobellus salinus]